MAQCELTGKGPVAKNLVSHSNIKTKTRALANIQNKRLFSKTLNQFVGLKLATSTIKTLERSGGFDQFVLRQKDSNLSRRALVIKQKLQRALSGKPKTTKGA